MHPIRYPPDLPVTARREDLLAALRGPHPVLIVAGETGSGKTTQLPKLCLEAGLGEPGRGQIGCTQPRRVAALSVSRRVAEELGVTWGREVGCKIRFQDTTAGRDVTRVKFMTDGILLAEVQSDPLLRAYSTLIIDEAHERSLNVDFLLGHLRNLLARRPDDLKVIITSATIDTAAFSKAFHDAPVIEVSGRSFPVEIRYDDETERSLGDADDDETHIAAAVRATEDLLIETDDGDVLVFFPTERDIREARELLEPRLGRGIEIVSLFGRMPAAEQARVFSRGDRRRVVLATNIAETSLTLPNVVAVVDTGLARLSRYSPRTRTKRLPVEPVAQSSADQRAGRAGRVRPGLCVRLFSREDYEKRPRYTQPEIQRANLAEVILRLKAFRLGDIETFPFLNPPAPAAVRAGYALLHELGALDDAHTLTVMGRELARLPVDPTLGRMLLQARREHVLPAVLAIAAGLSVPDPRERPEDHREAADAAHQVFVHPDSDFLTLLNLWRAAPDRDDSRGALRRFCKANFLSQTRMREWRDIHGQLADALAVRHPELPPGDDPPGDAIHRSVLTGLLGQVAQRKERNSYQSTANRLVTLFPGSGLFERHERTRRSREPQNAPPAAGAADEKTRQPPWIVAGEIVETSALFARTVARIQPEWVADLGAHLCKFSYADPHWSERSGRVLATERVLLSGLEILRRRVDYGKIEPVLATELFVRGALVAGEAVIHHRFFAHNRTVRERAEAALTRRRNLRVHDVDEALVQFYASRLPPPVSSLADLDRVVRERIAREPDFLCATEADLLGADGEDAALDPALFPARVAVGNSVLPVAYAYAPGEERDGVTVRVPLPVAETLTSGQLQWFVPGLRAELASVLLRALPKTVRRALMPLEPKVQDLVANFHPGPGDFLAELAAFLNGRYPVTVRAEDWPTDSLPTHLRPRVEVVGADQKTVATGRDLNALRADLRGRDLRTPAWDAAAKRWERRGLTVWTFGDLPESIVVETVAGTPLLAFSGLENDTTDGNNPTINVRLFRRREEAADAIPPAVRRLGERTLAHDLDVLRNDLVRLLAAPPKSVGRPAPAQSLRDAFSALTPKLPVAALPTAGPADLPGNVFVHVVGAALRLDPVFPLTEARFRQMTEAARRELPAHARRAVKIVRQATALRAAVLDGPRRYAGLEHDVARLIPADFPARVPPGQLAHVPRFLRAIAKRAERAVLDPAKDANKARALAPFADWERTVPTANRETFRWLLEEFRVAIFAPELGTSQPVSEKRLRALF